MYKRQVCSLVNKNVATGGGIDLAMRQISSSAIGPGPEGIRPTNPIADAPRLIAISASGSSTMQHTFTLGRIFIFHRRGAEDAEYRGDSYVFCSANLCVLCVSAVNVSPSPDPRAAVRSAQKRLN